ncbi:MAG: hypothetical protein BGO55_08460 [Sphingobacteriales bacterium 50-39]|nr:single-stranded DNA-binding protein [Sphingobacteriales bacterium]OJW59295.1 MAG: hypothetical protein BGO55_08460 [Sphingobacteriales bacterium 50-39]
MEISGRVTAKAKVTETKGGKKVVNFSLAINRGYRDKTTSEWKQKTTYIECAYWKNAGVGEFIRKGESLYLFGDLDVRAYIDKNGEAKGVIIFQVEKFLGFLGGRRKEEAPAQPAAASMGPVDDLPF